MWDYHTHVPSMPCNFFCQIYLALAIFGQFWPLWTILGHYGPLWTTLGHPVCVYKTGIWQKYLTSLRVLGSRRERPLIIIFSCSHSLLGQHHYIHHVLHSRTILHLVSSSIFLIKSFSQPISRAIRHGYVQDWNLWLFNSAPQLATTPIGSSWISHFHLVERFILHQAMAIYRVRAFGIFPWS